MLARIEPPRADFKALAKYLMEGHDRPPNPNRVAWRFAHNIFTDDPEVVAILMDAAASQSVRCTKPCYHLSINWRDDECPPPHIMQEVARKTIVLAGLGEHQAYVVGHGDKAHPHLHMMINRVHPDTGKAWSTSHDYARFDRIMKQLSDEYGFLYAPCLRYNPEETEDLPKGPTSPAYRAARRGAATSRPQWSANAASTYANRLSEHLERGATLEDVAHMVAEDGLTLEPKGTGYVVGDPTSYVKLSALGLQITAHGLAKRRPPRRKPRVPSPTKSAPARPWVDAVDIARAFAAIGLADKSKVQAAIQEARAKRAGWIARKPLIDQLLDDLKLSWGATTAAKPPPRRRPKPNRRPPPVRDQSSR